MQFVENLIYRFIVDCLFYYEHNSINLCLCQIRRILFIVLLRIEYFIINIVTWNSVLVKLLSKFKNFLFPEYTFSIIFVFIYISSWCFHSMKITLFYLHYFNALLLLIFTSFYAVFHHPLTNVFFYLLELCGKFEMRQIMYIRVLTNEKRGHGIDIFSPFLLIFESGVFAETYTKYSMNHSGWVDKLHAKDV